MTRLPAIAMVLPIIVGCADVLGIVSGHERDGAGGDVQGGGGGTGGMNAGGMNAGGNVGAGFPAPDWSGALGAVYSFEDVANPGACTNDASLDLSASGLVSSVPDGMVKAGTRVLQLEDTTDYLETSDALFGGAAPGLTFGGWFKVGEIAGNLDILGRADAATHGYLMTRGGGGSRAHCRVYAAGVLSKADGALNAFGDDAWSHVVCRIDLTAMNVAAFSGGSLDTEETITAFEAADGVFRIGDVASNGLDAFVGLADEVFFAPVPLSDASIERIWACRIDGSLCECDAAEPAAYRNCGRLLDVCESLPRCDGEPTPL